MPLRHSSNIAIINRLQYIMIKVYAITNPANEIKRPVFQ